MTTQRTNQPASVDVSERSLPELLASMTQDLSTLIRSEVELAKEEITVEARQAAKAGAKFGGAAGAALYAGIALVMTLGFLLDVFLPRWVAFLVVTIVLGAIAAVMAIQGRNQAKAIDPVPEATVETMKENAQWLTEQRN